MNESDDGFKLSFTEDGLTAETGLTIKCFSWNWLIIYPTFHHDVDYIRFCLESNLEGFNKV